MTDDRTTPPGDPKEPRTSRRGIVNADVPSQTLGKPSVGEGASAAHFARDLMPFQAEEPKEPPEDADPSDRAS